MPSRGREGHEVKGKERKSENCLFLSRSPSPSLLLSHFSHFKLLSLVHVPSPHSGRLLPLWYRFRSRHRPPPAARRPRRQHRTPLDPGEKREREREREREFFLTLRERRFFFSIVDAPLPLAAFLLFCCSTALGPAPRSRSVYLSCSARGTRTSSRRSRIGASSDSDCRERLFSSFRSLPATDGQANKERASEREREGAIAWGWFFLSPPDVLLLPPRSLPRAPLPRLRGSPNGVCRSSERAER